MDKRNTIQKRLVLDAVKELCCHATAQEVYKKVSSVYPSISQGTVYRNLEVLSEEGEIRKLNFPDDVVRYDQNCSEHCHVKCQKCGKVFDVDMDIIPNVTEKITNSHGFDFLGYEIFFMGICPNCKKTKKEIIK